MICLLFSSLYSSKVKAQAPQGFQYQAIVRGSNGNPLSYHVVSSRFTIHSGTPSGTIEYSETRLDTTAYDGIIVIVIGSGEEKVGEFDTIPWGSGLMFMQVEIDTSGGTNYVDMGTTQLLSVPYALYAQTSGSSLVGPTGPIGSTGIQGATGLTGATGRILYCLIKSESWHPLY